MATIVITWIIFPVIVMSKFNELLKLQRARDKEEREARQKIGTLHSDTNRALQWYVDNWEGPMMRT